MFDNICKFLVENFPQWLIISPVRLTQLSSESIRADSLILPKSL